PKRPDATGQQVSRGWSADAHQPSSGMRQRPAPAASGSRLRSVDAFPDLYRDSTQVRRTLVVHLQPGPPLAPLSEVPQAKAKPTPECEQVPPSHVILQAEAVLLDERDRSGNAAVRRQISARHHAMPLALGFVAVCGLLRSGRARLLLPNCAASRARVGKVRVWVVGRLLASLR